jgi:hypothetical protein
MPQDPQDVLSSTTKETFVSSTKAAEIATAYFGTLSNNPATKSNVRISSTETIVDSRNNNVPIMYVMNYAGGGFVIVGATRNYYPVLAYSDNNHFTITEDMPFGLTIWLDETKEAIRQSEEMDEETKHEMRNLWSNYELTNSNYATPPKTKSFDPAQEAAFQARISQLQSEGYECYRLSDAFYEGGFQETYGAYLHYCSIATDFGSPLEYTIFAYKGGIYQNEVGPLLETHWDQEMNFNKECSNYPDPAGCGIISTAQMMRYHEHPSSYTWSSMPNYYATYTTQLFIKDIQNIFGGPKAGVDKQKTAFQNFGYNATIHDHNAQSVRNQLLVNTKPVIMEGFTAKTIFGGASGDGHSWVCDGASESYAYQHYFFEFLYKPGGVYSYKNLEDVPSKESPVLLKGVTSLYFHMNWGWLGRFDDWFIHDDVNVGGYNFQHVRRNLYVSL